MLDIGITLRTLLATVEHLISTLPVGDDVGNRLSKSVRGPLRQLLQEPAGEAQADVDTAAEPADELWHLAKTITTLRVACPDLPGLIEATAALQDLALRSSDESSGTDRLAELAELQAGLVAGIQVAADGPYLVTNAASLLDWAGRDYPLRPQLALCRCGRSTIKPLCDGSHTTSGFSGAKDPHRVADRRDTYVGQQVTVADNRGICQHSGYCTDRLANVFHSGSEPFVTPSGGRMDEIIRAVRDCPSGALSYAVDGVESRADVDHHDTREQCIEVTKDGPYRVTGGIPLVDQDGATVARNLGASDEHFALCRCGHSQNKPFCSGMHWYVDFHDPVADSSEAPTIFEWAGGLPAFTRMTRLFYEKHVPQDPLLAPIFASMSADHPERVAKWLAEVFCGPKNYSAEYGGYSRMISQHVGKGLTEEQRARWVALIQQSALEAGLPNDPEFRSAFGAYIEWGSRLAVENSQADAKPPAHMPTPHWGWQTAAGPPGSRISAIAPSSDEPEQAVVLPAPGEPVRFGEHIKPLFRTHDRQSMRFAFDLWSYDDVGTHADAILGRLRAGSMPCDGAWSADRIDVFQRWIDGGKLDA